MQTRIAAIAVTLGLTLGFALPQVAHAYDPCQRALEQREVHRDAMRRYIANQCPANARYVPGDCNNPNRGYELLGTLNMWSQRVQELCH